MFVKPVDLGNGTGLELVIVPLKGSAMPGQWDTDTDLLMLWSRYTEKLDLLEADAKLLADWMSQNL